MRNNDKDTALIGIIVIMLTIGAIVTITHSPKGSKKIPSEEQVYNSVLIKKIDESDKLIYEIRDMGRVQIIGNSAYIPLNILGNPADHTTLILTVIEQFRKLQPNWEITDWKIEKQQDAHGRSAIIFGLWVDHKPKENNPLPVKPEKEE